MTQQSPPLHYEFTPAQGDVRLRPLVLIHGWCCSSADWAEFMVPLSRHADVFAVDLPGAGRSHARAGSYAAPAYADDVAELLDSLELDDVVAVGHSAGAEVAAALSLSRPDLVRATVSVDPAYGFPQTRVAEIRAVAERLEREDARQVAMDYFAAVEQRSAHPELVERHLQSVRQTDPATIRRMFSDGAFGAGNLHFRPDTDAALGRRTRPLLAIYRSEALAEVGRSFCFLPQDRVVAYDGAGHWLHQEQPDRFLAEVTAWLSAMASAEPSASEAAETHESSPHSRS